MTDLVELQITRGLAKMRDEMHIPQPGNVVEFPRCAVKVVPAQQTIYGRMADCLLAIEHLADYMAVMAREAERGNLERQKIIDMLRTGESAARNALERLES